MTGSPQYLYIHRTYRERNEFMYLYFEWESNPLSQYWISQRQCMPEPCSALCSAKRKLKHWTKTVHFAVAAVWIASSHLREAHAQWVVSGPCCCGRRQFICLSIVTGTVFSPRSCWGRITPVTAGSHTLYVLSVSLIYLPSWTASPSDSLQTAMSLSQCKSALKKTKLWCPSEPTNMPAL
jgi:hypothetical protein